MGTVKQKPFSIEVADEMTVVRFFRKPTVSETIDAMDDSVAGGVTFRQIWVFQCGINFSTDELRTLARHGIKIAQRPSRNAFVAPDDFSFGLARMYEVFRDQEGYEIRVFRGEQEAIAWLNEE